ncbi:zinc-finger domain-containing protein [Paenibacillus sinopodophylli]|uniref:zinc-finger domain-containing protein n=1 Tax=Paenibacillus sinopodophylli TaxID=1837342 RepID=UPI003CCC7DCE
MREIGSLLDGRCDGCPQLKELNRIHGHSTSHVDGYCQRTCEVGLKLKGLGEQLNATLSPRVELAFDDEEYA